MFFAAFKGFIAFCIVSSAVYVFNDISDKDADAAHPLKKNRPIASGVVSIQAAVLMSVVLLGIASVVCLSLPSGFQAVIISYLILQILYSLGLKKIVILDVFIIAAGFMLRVLGGAEVIDVAISHWIILCTMFLSLFIALSKRRGEIMLFKHSDGISERKVLEEYDVHFLDNTIMITASGMAIAYALYTVADRTVAAFGSDSLIFTTIFVLFGIFRYLFLVMRKNMGENSVVMILKDMPMFIDLCLWFLSCVVIIYH